MIKQLNAYLSASVALASALETKEGESPAIWYHKAPQGAALPHLVFTVISNIPDQSSLTMTGQDEIDVQFDVYAENYASADSIIDALILLINRPGETFEIEADGEIYGIKSFRTTSNPSDLSDYKNEGTEEQEKRLMIESHISAFKKSAS